MHKPGSANLPQVGIEFYLPCAALRPYVTTYYHTRVSGPAGTVVEDWLHPEWANLRFHDAPGYEGAIGGGPVVKVPRAVMTGPTSLATHFLARPSRSWGIGLLPLGWAKFTDAVAADYADRFCDGAADPAFSALASVGPKLFRAGADLEADKERIEAHLLALLDRRAAREAEIVSVQNALLDSSLHSVSDFVAAVGMNKRTLERFARNVFGFAPQTLLRRQRFLRSLARFMLDPSLSWIDTLDSHYHDQAHFVRDFKRFMTMSPREYARLPHPVLMAAARARMAIAGEAVQGLHRPSAP